MQGVIGSSPLILIQTPFCICGEAFLYTQIDTPHNIKCGAYFCGIICCKRAVLASFFTRNQLIAGKNILSALYFSCII